MAKPLSKPKSSMPQPPPPSPAPECILPEDDGRTVASMNIEGMPWYNPKANIPKNPNSEPISTRNLWRYAFYAVLAGLLIVLVFGVGAAAFLWFCTRVWFG